MRTNELQHQFEKYVQTVEGSSDEVHAAETIQQMLLHDDIPFCDMLSCFGLSIPAYKLSGDYYDFIYDEQNGRYWVLVGDVMGKGIPASLMMVMLRSTARVLTRYCETPSELVSNLNNILLKDMTRLRAFSTLFCGLFDTHTSEFLYTSAGHPSPILMKQNQATAERLEGKGTVVGILKDRKYSDFSIPLAKGDLLVLCTDGILEAMDKDKTQYGYARLKKVIEANQNLSLSELIGQITSDVKYFAEGHRRDDVTIVAVRCECGEPSQC